MSDFDGFEQEGQEMEADTIRGSRKHVLDWTSRPEFLVELLQLIVPVEVRISANSLWMPRGYDSIEEARLETFGRRALPNESAWKALRLWWLAHEEGANTPNWDIALSCEIEGRSGLVLVEAKAHVAELSPSPKLFDPRASPASHANHAHIGSAINEACGYLKELHPTVAISRDSHYQLSNRIAFAWKLASLGIPTVLVYLGFCGDDGIRDVGDPFRDAAHWNETFAQHAHTLVPGDLFDRRLDCGKAPAWFLARARDVLEVSPQHSVATLTETEAVPL